jgi:hypothetical protein
MSETAAGLHIMHRKLLTATVSELERAVFYGKPKKL